ncbi:MAG: ABC transporter permease [Halothiobacillus sp.]|jgi:cell division transport system permease protein|uniref:cell division protein FtsX n=1 Tax=Halothiobacillus sp. TaxID=1891311 RepID=UPI002AD222C2|nr:ABC transporter permease [Halothiobacillus sp.]MDA3876500.1 ABC transporter permease [Halothiobacillus sp.]
MSRASPNNLTATKTNTKSLARGEHALSAWAHHHRRCFKDALWRLLKRPISAWATIVTIAIVLALPGFIMTLATQIKQIGGMWASENGQMNVYLIPSAQTDQIQSFQTWLNHQSVVRDSRLITPQEGLHELAKRLNIDSLTDIQPNPLPSVIVVHLDRLTGDTVESLQHQIRTNPLVDNISEGGEWIKRLQEISLFFDRLSWWLLGLFGLTVIFVIGNTLRLELQERREELSLMALIGGTSRYMLRPLLYDGAITGLLGGMLASVIIYGLLTALAAPINNLATNYGAHITVITPLLMTALLGIIGLILGWFSAQIIGRNFIKKSVKL